MGIMWSISGIIKDLGTRIIAAARLLLRSPEKDPHEGRREIEKNASGDRKFFGNKFQVRVAIAMIRRGDSTVDIARWLNVPETEIESLRKDKSARDERYTEIANLPPPGPYPSGRTGQAALNAIREAENALVKMFQTLDRLQGVRTDFIELFPRRAEVEPDSPSEDAQMRQKSGTQLPRIQTKAPKPKTRPTKAKSPRSSNTGDLTSGAQIKENREPDRAAAVEPDHVRQEQIEISNAGTIFEPETDSAAIAVEDITQADANQATQERNIKPTAVALQDVPEAKIDTEVSRPATSKPSAYRPPTRRPRTPTQGAHGSSSRVTDPEKGPSEVLIRLSRKKGELFMLMLLRRGTEMPDFAEAQVRGADQVHELQSIHEDWYETYLPVQEKYLEDGVVLDLVGESSTPAKWSLSGRAIFVFGQHPEIGGWVQRPRLRIGEKQSVLCREEIRTSALAAIEAAESPSPTVSGGLQGLPAGWVLLDGVIPRSSEPKSDDNDILSILDPLPDIEISLSGGMRIDRGVWLTGFPPKIAISPAQEHVSNVVIDGVEASHDPISGFVTKNCFELGTHEVFVGGISKTYSIVDIDPTWKRWPAHTARVGNSTLTEEAVVSVCGAAAWCEDESGEPVEPITVPNDTPVLIGDEPGQIFACSDLGRYRASGLVEFPPFEPTWALPANPLRCANNVTVKRLSVAGNPISSRRGISGPLDKKLVAAWAKVIREAGYRHLGVEPNDAAAASAWQTLRRKAKSSWRSLR